MVGPACGKGSSGSSQGTGGVVGAASVAGVGAEAGSRSGRSGMPQNATGFANLTPSPSPVGRGEEAAKAASSGWSSARRQRHASAWMWCCTATARIRANCSSSRCSSASRHRRWPHAHAARGWRGVGHLARARPPDRRAGAGQAAGRLRWAVSARIGVLGVRPCAGAAISPGGPRSPGWGAGWWCTPTETAHRVR